MQLIDKTVIYDRGMPDIIAYARLFNLAYLPAYQASKLYRYETNVFIFPAWKEIYTTDEERTMSFEAAKAFGQDVQNIYKEHAYNLIELPYTSPEERARFIMERIT